MSYKGQFEVSGDDYDEYDGKYKGCCNKYSCQGAWFFIFNSIFWLISIGLISLAGWILATAELNFTLGDLILLSMVTVGSISFILCILGFLALIYDHQKLSLSYIIIFVFLILAEVSLVVYVKMTNTPEGVIHDMWHSTNPYLLGATSKNLKCCGHKTWNDTYTSIDDVPVGCADPDTKIIYTAGCGQAIYDYFVSPTIYPYFIVIISLPALFKILAFIFGCVFYDLLKKKEAYTTTKITSKNKVAPVTMTSHPSTSGTKGFKSAASGKDVDVFVKSPQSNKGNEVLFIVADKMLE